MPRKSDPLRIFAPRLIAWHATHGRHDLPWQGTKDAYRIWVSEIMLQQTQVATVIPYYERFMTSFPDVVALASAPEDAVLAHWAGLGYYARARNLHRAAQQIRDRHEGVFPDDIGVIRTLPGIGRSTAAAIAAFAFGQAHAILDGNVKRVLARCFGVEGFPGDRAVESGLWQLAESLLPSAEEVPIYIQAQMDLGATLCARNRPRCGDCPVVDLCIAHRDDRVADLPARRPTKTVPRRETGMLILRSGGELLLQKRSPTGVWGGMWCFPECPALGSVMDIAEALTGGAASAGPALPPLQHGFTHFHLTIHPRVVDVAHRARQAMEPGMLWLGLEDAIAAAIPKPVKTLLLQLQALQPSQTIR